jgi:hypothetical protein
LFSVVFTPSLTSHHASVWLLPVISLLLTNTVPPVRGGLAYPYVGRGFVDLKGSNRGPLGIQSSLVRHVHVQAIRFGRFHTVYMDYHLTQSFLIMKNDWTKSNFPFLGHSSVKAGNFSTGKVSNKRSYVF